MKKNRITSIIFLMLILVVTLIPNAVNGAAKKYKVTRPGTRYDYSIIGIKYPSNTGTNVKLIEIDGKKKYVYCTFAALGDNKSSYYEAKNGANDGSIHIFSEFKKKYSKTSPKLYQIIHVAFDLANDENLDAYKVKSGKKTKAKLYVYRDAIVNRILRYSSKAIDMKNDTKYKVLQEMDSLILKAEKIVNQYDENETKVKNGTYIINLDKNGKEKNRADKVTLVRDDSATGKSQKIYNSPYPVNIDLINEVNDNPITYTLSVKDISSDSTVYLCPKINSSTSSCTKIGTNVIKKEEDYKEYNKKHYVRVVNGDPNDSFKLELKIEVKNYKLPDGEMYYYVNDLKARSIQPVFLPTYTDEDLPVKTKTVSYKIPPEEPTPPPGGNPTPETKKKYVSYSFEIEKVNKDGEALTGAKFSAHIVKKDGAKENITLTENGSIYSWNSNTITLTCDANGNNCTGDNYEGSHLCYFEDESPNGYITNKADKSGNCDIVLSQNNSTVCLKKDDDSTNTTPVDMAFCKATVKDCPAGQEATTKEGVHVCINKVEQAGSITYECGEGQGSFVNTEEHPNSCKIVQEIAASDKCSDGSDGEAIEGNEEIKSCISYINATPKCPNGDPPESQDGKCYESQVNKAICTYNGKDYSAEDGEELANACNTTENYVTLTSTKGNFSVTEVNEKNSVTISKKAATGGDEEVPGAALKICAKATYGTNGTKCEPATTVDGEKLEWVSDYTQKTFSGIPVDQKEKKSTYVIIETIPPSGFALEATTVTEFTIDNDGKVTSKANKTISTENGVKDIIVINNRLNKMSISKTDIVTTKELPGAIVSICQTKTDINKLKDDERKMNYGDENIDENDETIKDGEAVLDRNSNLEELDSKTDMLLDINGNCIPAILRDGSEATWVSTDKPHEVEGLTAGTYYLVEIAAPKGYSTAESIKFTMKEDGTLTDENGKSLKNNKLVMRDKPIVEVKTGDILLLIITTLGLLGLGIGSYYYFNNKKDVMKKIKRFNRVKS